MSRVTPLLHFCKSSTAPLPDDNLLFSFLFIRQSEEDLMREIAAVELEISHLEQHLLSLYRALFNVYFGDGGAGAHHSGSLPSTSPRPSRWFRSDGGPPPPPEEEESQSSLLASEPVNHNLCADGNDES